MNEVLGGSLRHLVDHAEITALAVAYCWTIDGHDWDGLDGIFTDHPDRVVTQAAQWLDR